jgi:hypothetical protein
VGRVEGSAIPEWHVSGKAVWPQKWWDMYKTKSGQPFPADLMTKGMDYFYHAYMFMTVLCYANHIILIYE